MIKAGTEFRTAITAHTRRMLLKAILGIVDPDLTYGDVVSSGLAGFARPEQLRDQVFDLHPYVTLERNRWLLNGKMRVMPKGGPTEQVGAASRALSGADGTFSSPQWVEQPFSNVKILQACSVFFPKAAHDGVPVDFTVEVRQGGTVYHSQAFTGNRADHVNLTGFTVNYPDAIRVTVTRWSLPGRRMRTVEIIPGLYEEWASRMFTAFNVVQQADFSCLSIPYGTCTIRVNNKSRRFEPLSKAGVFQSITERQGINVYLGVRLADGSDAHVKAGRFYQQSGGYTTGNNDLTIEWTLVDIIGLLANREYKPPEALPTTLEGWIASLVAQLGVNFEGLYTVDPAYANLPLTAALADIQGKKCGEILRWACMATGTWPRADAETGNLACEPFWSEGSKLTLSNLAAYPTIKANRDLAAIFFTLNDGSRTQYVVSGNSTASSDTVSVSNPFLHDQAAALTAARMILATYGGNRIETTGRGDPASEIGDVDTVWLNESSATTGRRMMQTFQFANGIMRNCRSTLLQADGSFLFQDREVITGSGSWTGPAGVTQIRYIVVGPGSDGKDGKNGSWEAAGENGADGSGGKVVAGTMHINEGQTFHVSISDTVTTFGSYSSANGKVYQYGYTDIASGNTYARSGVKKPLPGSGDGGAGGKGGVQGRRRTVTTTNGDGSTSSKVRVDNYPGDGTPGSAGATGCVVIYYDKEAGA